MNLKRISVFALLLATSIPSSSKDFKRFYINAGSEYAVPFLGRRGFEGQSIYGFLPPSTGGRILSSWTTKKASFAEGLWLGGNIGYCITPNLAFDLGIQVGLKPNKKKYRETLDRQGDQFTRTTYLKNPLLLLPAIKYRYPIGSNFLTYAKAGVVLPIGTKLYIDDWEYPDYLTSSEVETKFSPGFTSGVGGEYRVAKQLWVSAEINFLALNVDVKKMTIVSYSENGQDLLYKIPESRRTTYYDDKALYDPGSQQGTAIVLQPFELPCSKLGLKLGLSYYF